MEDLLNKAKFLSQLGTQVSPNVELSRLISKALKDLSIAVINYEYGLSQPYGLTDEDKFRAMALSKLYCISNVVISLEEVNN